MPKQPPGREPEDPMARVVDRLLAGLPGLQGSPVVVPESQTRFPTVVGGSSARRTHIPTQSEIIGVWIRVVLGLSLGVMMAMWPYQQACGEPLLGYFAALLILILAGGWAATAAWRHRTGLAHLVALILMFYGILLAGAVILPRTGYAAVEATWFCVG